MHIRNRVTLLIYTALAVVFLAGISGIAGAQDQETISAPNKPRGVASVVTGTSYAYATGGAVSSLGHPVEYRFNWGDGSYSNWSPIPSAVRIWPSAGTFSVTVVARCVAHPEIVSPPSEALTVTVAARETVSTPGAPGGPTSGYTDDNLTFTTEGSVSSYGDPVQYRFNWGDGNYSEWTSSTSVTKTWPEAGTYAVRVEARCGLHNDIVSEQSDPLIVTIETDETVSTPDIYGPHSGRTIDRLSFIASGAVSSKSIGVEYRFNWGDGRYGRWIRPYGGNSSVTDNGYWYTAGEYEVTVEARSILHPEVVSLPSTPWLVTITQYETIETPATPDGPVSGIIDSSYTFSTNELQTSLGHACEYRFNWGDGTYSNWTTLTTAKKHWITAGTFPVTVEARSSEYSTEGSLPSEPLTVTIINPETISTPVKPEGPVDGVTGERYKYTTGGAESSIGHHIEYRFNWDDGTYSVWQPGTSARKTWELPGTYHVTVEAHCYQHTDRISSPSDTLTVTIAFFETVSTPDMPDGPDEGWAGVNYTYTAGGAESSLGHQVAYRFNWGDGTYSDWLPEASAEKAWELSGTYGVTVEAQCSEHLGVISLPSDSLTVIITSALSVEEEIVRCEITGLATVKENKSAQYTCTVYYDDGSSATVTDAAVWSVASSHATVHHGLLSAEPVSSDSKIDISASYEGISASLAVTIENDDDTGGWGGSKILATGIREDFPAMAALPGRPVSVRRVTRADGLSPLPGLIGSPVTAVYAIGPAGVFSEPMTVRIPVESDAEPEDIVLYYYSTSDSHAGWYRGDRVAGWLAAGDMVTSVNGHRYYEFTVNHSGIVQLVETGQVRLAGVTGPDYGVDGAAGRWNWLGWVILLLCMGLGCIMRSFRPRT